MFSVEKSLIMFDSYSKKKIPPPVYVLINTDLESPP